MTAGEPDFWTHLFATVGGDVLSSKMGARWRFALVRIDREQNGNMHNEFTADLPASSRAQRLVGSQGLQFTSGTQEGR